MVAESIPNERSRELLGDKRAKMENRAGRILKRVVFYRGKEIYRRNGLRETQREGARGGLVWEKRREAFFSL